MCRVDGEESWVLDVRTWTSIFRGQQRILNEAVLMEKVHPKRLEDGKERDEKEASWTRDGVHVSVKKLERVTVVIMIKVYTM